MNSVKNDNFNSYKLILSNIFKSNLLIELKNKNRIVYVIILKIIIMKKLL